MRHVDLCSGIGGFALGFNWAGLSQPVLFCDIEKWSRRVLAKHWPNVPIAHDVKELASDPARLVPDCDILTAGYPCQPFSVAGQQRGAADHRHIWPEIFTIVQAKRPAWCVFENVSGHISLGLDQVLSDLESKGYAVQPFVVPACAVDAPHRRDRVWIIARNLGNAAHNGCSGWGKADGREGQTHQLQQQSGVRGELVRPSEDVADTDSEGLRGEIRGWQTGTQRTPSRHLAKCGSNVADADNEGSQGRLSGRQDTQWQGEHGHPRCSSTAHRQSGKDKSKPVAFMGGMAHGLPTGLDGFDGWEREPEDIPRVATGVKDRVNRLKGLGNAIVPQIAMQIGLTIKAIEHG